MAEQETRTALEKIDFLLDFLNHDTDPEALFAAAHTLEKLTGVKIDIMINPRLKLSEIQRGIHITRYTLKKEQIVDLNRLRTKIKFDGLVAVQRKQAKDSVQAEPTGGGGEPTRTKKSKEKEPLEVRVAREITRDPTIDSIRIGKLLGANNGVVRGTRAWQNRKQLRSDMPKQSAPHIKTDISGGFSKEGNRREIDPAIDEPKSHHHDINEMISDFHLGKRKKYPTPTDIAERLNSEEEPVSIAQAKTWLKETVSIFGYDYES